MSNATKRVNIRMSDAIFKFYDDLAREMGVSRSYVMVMALKHYMDVQDSIKIGRSMPDWFNQLETLKK